MGKTVTRLQSNSVTAHEVNNSIALLLNKIFELTGEDQRVNISYGELLGRMFAFYAMKKIKDIYDFGSEWTFEDFRQWEYTEELGGKRWIDTLPDEWKARSNRK